MPKLSLVPPVTPTLTDKALVHDPEGVASGIVELQDVLELFSDQNNIPSGGGSPVTRHVDKFNNFVASGGNWSADSLGSTRNGSMSAMVAYMSGIRYSVNAVSGRAFTASKDTYIFLLDDGTLDYQEVTNGATKPSQPSDSMPLALVVTSSTAITKVIEFFPRNYNEIARTKVVSGGGDSVIVPYLPAYKILDIEVIVEASGGTADVGVTFNGDTAANYARQEFNNSASLTVVSSNTVIALESNTTGSGTASFSYMKIMNVATLEKYYKLSTLNNASSGAANAPRLYEGWGKWANTSAQINSIEFTNTGTGDFGSNTEIIVYGRK